MAKQGQEFPDNYTVDAHLEKKLFMRYTDDPEKAAGYIDDLERFLTMESYKVVGLNIDFTKRRTRKQYVTVLQLCICDNVFLYHFCRASSPCQRLGEFLGNDRYTFATVDTDNGKKVLGNSGLKVAKLIDIQKQYRVAGM